MSPTTFAKWTARIVLVLFLFTMATCSKVFGQNLLPIQDSYDVVALCHLEKYAGGQYVEISSIPTWKSDFSFYYERERALGKTEAEMARATPLVAAVQHYVWGTSATGVNAPNISRANIFIGHGQFAVNRHMDWAYATVSGTGPGNVFANAVVPRGGGGTEIVMWIDKWIYDSGCKVNLPELGPQDNLVACAFRSVTFNAEGTVGAYHELAGMDNIHVSSNAPAGFKAGRLVVGWLAWDLGSASKLGNVYVNNVDCAFIFTRGTPGQIEKVTGMGGNIALFLFLGTCDALYDFESWECDDFPAVYITRAQWGRESGLRFHFDAGKFETGVTKEDRNPWTGTIFADLKGRNTIQGGLLNAAQANVKIESLIVLDDRDGVGVPQPNLFQFILCRWTTDANIIHEVGGNVYGNPAVFQWDSQEVYYKKMGAKRTVEVDREVMAPLPGIVGYKSRLGFQRYNGTDWAPAFSHSAGTPVFKYSSTGSTTPPPIPCTYTYSTWSTCTNNTQTRSVITSDPAGCSGSPVLTQSCTSAPARMVFASTFSGSGPNLVATTGTTIAPAISWSKGNFASGTISTTGNVCYPWTAGTATKVVLRDFVISNTPFNWQRITAEHKVAPDGIVWHGNTPTSVKLTAGTRYTAVELPCPEGGKLTTVIGGALNSGSTATMSIGSIEIWQ